MKQLGIKSIICKKFRVISTDSNHVHIPSENLLNRDFTASELRKKWVSDFTYVKTLQRWFYLTIIMDLYKRGSIRMRRIQEPLKAYKINQSMSRKGNCWDNEVAESFFKIIKSEMIYHTQYQDQNLAKTEIFEFIENWYNVKTKHSYLNYLTPYQFGETNKTIAA
jgi:putative transposase